MDPTTDVADNKLVTIDTLDRGVPSHAGLGSWIVLRGWGAVVGMVAMTAVVVWGGLSLCWSFTARGKSRVETLVIRDAD